MGEACEGVASGRMGLLVLSAEGWGLFGLLGVDVDVDAGGLVVLPVVLVLVGVFVLAVDDAGEDCDCDCDCEGEWVCDEYAELRPTIADVSDDCGCWRWWDA